MLCNFLWSVYGRRWFKTVSVVLKGLWVINMKMMMRRWLHHLKTMPICTLLWQVFSPANGSPSLLMMFCVCCYGVSDSWRFLLNNFTFAVFTNAWNVRNYRAVFTPSWLNWWPNECRKIADWQHFYNSCKFLSLLSRSRYEMFWFNVAQYYLVSEFFNSLFDH